MIKTTSDRGVGPELALEFANTLVSDRSGRDLLSHGPQLRDWIAARASQLGPVSADTERLAEFRRLRTSIRGLLAAVAAGQPLHDADATIVNGAAVAAASWPELVIDDSGAPSSVGRSAATDPTAHALADIAASAIRLVGSPDRLRVGACEGPGCRRFFLAKHHARRWCDSGVCGNRVRVASWARRRRAEHDSASRDLL